jgi:hypothetical protein
MALCTLAFCGRLPRSCLEGKLLIACQRKRKIKSPAATKAADSTIISRCTGRKKVRSIPPPNAITTTPAARHRFFALIATPPGYGLFVISLCRSADRVKKSATVTRIF